MPANQNFPSEQVLKTLQDPVRRGLFDYVSRSAQPVSREAAAQVAGISRTLAAYHLEHLSSAGLLSATYARPDGKTGPGAGRPAKLYEAVHDEVLLSMPSRNYRLLGSLLAAAAESDPSGTVRHALGEAARVEGERCGALQENLSAALQALGYEPRIDDQGAMTLANCPFHSVAQQHAELVCEMNHQLVSGILDGCGQRCQRAQLQPGEGRCCVVIVPD